MSEHEQRPNEDEQGERDETVEDLDMPESDSDDVTGGAAAPWKVRPDQK